jgi:hypothetical protein
MKATFASLFLAFAFAACQPAVKAPEVAPTPEAAPTTATDAGKQVDPNSGCFMLAEANKDTTVFSFNSTVTGEVTGISIWHPYQEHGAVGTLTGKMTGDIMTGEYTYTVEGNTQTEEVMYKIGLGEVIQADFELTDDFKKKKLVRKKDAPITYNEAKKMTRVGCSQVQYMLDWAK